jgi:hypothetical protein
MGCNPYEHVCEWFDFECMCKNDRNVYLWKDIKSTNFILGTNTISTNLRIHEMVIFNQTTKIDTHEEKYFHSISFRKPHVIGQKVDMWLGLKHFLRDATVNEDKG